MATSSAKPFFADIPDVLPDDVPAVATTPPVELWSRVHGEPETLGRTHMKRALALTASLLWAGAELAALGIRGDLAELSISYVFVLFVAPFALGVVSVVVALGRGRLGLGPRFSVVALLAIVGSLSVGGAGLIVPEPVSAARADLRSLFFCANLALVWAAVPLVAAALSLRGAFASSPVWRSALLGTAIGLGAAVAAELRCPLSDRAHVAFAHGGAVLFATFASALLLSRVTRV